MKFIIFATLLILNAGYAFSSVDSGQALPLTHHWVGMLSLIIFLIAYVLVIFEEKTQLRKSKPVLLAAGIIWILIAIAYTQEGYSETVEVGIRHTFLEYSELFFFLLVAMTYINSLIERGLFDELRNRLVASGCSFRMLFWITGFLAFFISPIADNLTTALILCAVVVAVGESKPAFIAIACTNIVVAANAGGAFSPFGDITTLMVWQKGVLPFEAFLSLFIPSLINFIVPALIMHWFVPKGLPELAATDSRENLIKPGAIVIAWLFILTIITAVSLHTFLHIPPVFGMLLGLAYLKFYGFYLRVHHVPDLEDSNLPGIHTDKYSFDIFDKVAQAEWDTLFFFYGVVMAVGGLGYIGYLNWVSHFMYGELGATTANILVGILSAIVDNIPVMFAVLTMEPDMPKAQWLLVTLTAGAGGSLLSIGSAAGVALMGQAKGQYTFFSHLKWTPAIACGYAMSIWVHLLING